MRKVLLALIALVVLLPRVAVHAQFEAKCGDVLESEFKEERKVHVYSIELEAGDKLRVAAKPLGDTLQVSIVIRSPTKRAISDNDPAYYDLNYAKPEVFPIAETKVVAATGTYSFVIGNSTIRTEGEQGTTATSEYPSGIGLYSVSITCTKRDGTVIKPGDTTQSSVGGAAVQPGTVPTNGFPGLAPIDFSQADPARIPRSGEVEDEIAPTATGPSVFTFEATEGQQINLTFTRLSGNLNLGLVVIDETNKVYFISSLVAATETNSVLTLPAGKYRIGVFKLDLVPPTAPETTVFAITLK